LQRPTLKTLTFTIAALAVLVVLAVTPARRGGAQPAQLAVEGRLSHVSLGSLNAAEDRPWRVNLPDDNRREVAVEGDVFGGKLRLALKLGADPGRSAVRLSVYLVNKYGWFYKSRRDFLLTHRRFREVVIDLAPDSADLVPAGSARPWGEMAGTAMRRVGLALFAEGGGYRGPVLIRDARLVEGSTGSSIRMGAPAVEGLEVFPEEPVAGELVEMAFSFPVAFANPFDPETADISAKIITPGGHTLTVPAFFAQDFVPVQEGFEVRAVPVGPGRWKVRFRSRGKGTHKVGLLWAGEKFADVAVEVGARRQGRGGPSESEASDAYVGQLATVGGEGFLRRLPADPSRCSAVWKRGGFETGPRMNAVTSGWAAPLEWTGAWGSWLGLGRYNMEVAWKLDIALDRSARQGAKRPLLLNFEGMFASGGRHPLDDPRAYGGDYLQSGRYRWAFNPLSSRLGGPLTGPGGYFKNADAGKRSRALFRYLAARYGQHPAVEGLVLGASFPAEGVAEWHLRTGTYLSKCLGASDGGTGMPALHSYHPQAVPMSTSKEIGSFEVGSSRGWRLSKAVCPTSKGKYSTAIRSQGGRSLRIDGDFPGEVFCLMREIDGNWARYEQLTFDAYLPPETPKGMRVRVQAILRDRELNWYEVLLPGELRRGDWTKMVLDLRPGRSGLKPVPPDASRPELHREWDDYSRQRIKVVGMRFFAWQGGASDKSASSWASSGPATRQTHAGGSPEARPVAAKSRPKASYRGPIFIDNIRLAGGARIVGPAPALAFTDFKSENARQPETFSKVEYSFKLNRAFDNPYDPDIVEVRAQVMNLERGAADVGLVKYVPGFYYQGYQRRLVKTISVIDSRHKRRDVTVPGGAEELLPEGGSWWKVRLAAAEPGKHLVTIQVLVPGANGEKVVVLQKKGLTFTAMKGKRRGYIRLARDGRHFEHSGGEFFYPLGMALRSPSDARDLGRDTEILKAIRGSEKSSDWVALPYNGGRPDYVDMLHARGTYQFEDYIKKSSAAGANWARVWMCPWWLALEWDHRYPGYEGAGRYNLANAWRMDHVLEQAEMSGMFLQVCLTNHGQVSARIDREWDFHPYRKKMPKRLWKAPDRPSSEPEYQQAKRPGGFLQYPRDWFLDKRARQLVRKRLRYVVARWGYSPHIMGFALMSEVEFTGGTEFKTDRNFDGRKLIMQSDWHKEMADYLRTIDPNRHLVTTHFSHPQNGNAVWNTQSLDYVQSNAYSSFQWLQDERGRRGGGRANATIGAPAAMRDYYRRYMSRWKRPVVIGEWGGHWMGNKKAILDAELHTGLWAQVTTPMAGATGYWWWLHVHYNKRYGEFAAVSRFVKGEDLRGVNHQLVTRVAVAKGLKAGTLEAMAVGNGANRAYAYVYARELTKSLAVKPEYKVDEVTVTIGGLAADTYAIEFWDTWTGRPSGKTAAVTTRGGPLTVKLPAFKGDLAMKIRGRKKLKPRPEGLMRRVSTPPSTGRQPIPRRDRR
jgi:hypothetical protein